jgi:hypothetical protein
MASSVTLRYSFDQNEVPESHYGVIEQGQDRLLPFTPRQPG